LQVGEYSSGPVWGRIADLRGPRIPLIGASIRLLLGYSGIKCIYDDGVGGGTTVSALHESLERRSSNPPSSRLSVSWHGK
ncbi:hypothetical protein HYDPIDRAFT_88135, partial [Hydnomerulius pinastri MD-312]